jgi:hypothetical protein
MWSADIAGLTAKTIYAFLKNGLIGFSLECRQDMSNRPLNNCLLLRRLVLFLNGFEAFKLPVLFTIFSLFIKWSSLV